LATKIKNSVEYTGLADTIPEVRSSFSFRLFTIEGEFFIPGEKPDIDHIYGVSAGIGIDGTRTISSAVKVSLEGQAVTGNTILINGSLTGNIKYIPCGSVPALYGTCFSVPFTVSAALSPNFSDDKRLDIESFIEDMFVHPTGKKTIYISASVLLVIKTVC
jgi:hypothetical protein